MAPGPDASAKLDASSAVQDGSIPDAQGQADASAPDAGTTADSSLIWINCADPGNAGSIGHDCNFLLSPNFLYPDASTNNNLPEVATPKSSGPRGDADPCARADPSSGRIYLTYTYAKPAGGFLSTNLAVSENGGASWDDPTSTPAWSGEGPVPDPYTGAGSTGGTGVVNSETSNIAFRSVSGGVVLYGIHSVYWLSGSSDEHTSRLNISETYLPAKSEPATIRQALADAKDSAKNVAALQEHPGVSACPGPDCASVKGADAYNLQSAEAASTLPVGESPADLADCTWFHEPALHWQEKPAQKLYLVVHCQSNKANHRIVVFGTATPATDQASTGGVDSPAAWKWEYEGVLLSKNDATNAAAAYGLNLDKPYFTQSDVAAASDGGLLVLASLVHLVNTEESRVGVVILGVKSLSPPLLAAATTKTAGAAPYVGLVQLDLSKINGGDQGRGAGSSTYDPALTATGVVYAGRTFPGLPAATGFEADLFYFPGARP
jgi:hypothetical protein